ncbi:MAG: hypothetical protein LC777_11090 [Actinobacteria bacterium]|nr:hypothetical protein [Actinomycetota bacterium]
MTHLRLSTVEPAFRRSQAAGEQHERSDWVVAPAGHRQGKRDGAIPVQPESGARQKTPVRATTVDVASIIALVWLLAMLGLFGWLLCWDRSERRDHERPPTRHTDLDVLAARARNGDETCKRYLWETLIDDLTDYRDVRWVLEYRTGVTNISCPKPAAFQARRHKHLIGRCSGGVGARRSETPTKPVLRDRNRVA